MRCLSCGHEENTSYNRVYPILCPICSVPMIDDPDYHPPRKARSKSEMLDLFIIKD
jgi:predicted Zn-ribbon and HTH transcriptional regulator